MTELTIVRHGETDWNLARRIQGITDIPLNDTGRVQATDTAIRLSGEEWHAIVSSPLGRARETAEIIARTLRVEKLEIEKDLVERAYGEAEGLEAATLAQLFPNMQGVRGIERRSDVTRRVLPALERIALTHPDQRILVVAHGGVIGALVRYVTERALPEKGRGIPNGSAHRFLYEDGVLVLNEFNGAVIEPPIRRAAPIKFELTSSN